MDENERNALSRRQMVGGAGFGMAMTAAGPAFAQQNSQGVSNHESSESTMEDPRSKYPKPPFKKQTQAWPGLARDMDPKPDHGEASYRGGLRNGLVVFGSSSCTFTSSRAMPATCLTPVRTPS